MRKSYLMLAGCASLFMVVTTPATATSIEYSNTPGSSIMLDPTDGCGGGVAGCFSFSSGNSIQVTSGTATGFSGGISGLFGVGTISSSGVLETAGVSGTGMLTIFDGSTTLTADLSWVDIATFGTAGSLNTGGTANLQNIHYTGSNADLVTLASATSGVQTATFQFSAPTSLTDLFTTRSTTTASSFSGSIAPVPLPATTWLFGSGLLGLAGMARRKTA